VSLWDLWFLFATGGHWSSYNARWCWNYILFIFSLLLSLFSSLCSWRFSLTLPHPDEVTAGFHVLNNLTNKHLSLMAPFQVFIKGILDYLEELKTEEIRKLFTILATLSLKVSTFFFFLFFFFLNPWTNSSNFPPFFRISLTLFIFITKWLQGSRPHHVKSPWWRYLCQDCLSPLRHCCYIFLSSYSVPSRWDPSKACFQTWSSHNVCSFSYLFLPASGRDNIENQQ